MASQIVSFKMLRDILHLESKKSSYDKIDKIISQKISSSDILNLIDECRAEILKEEEKLRKEYKYIHLDDISLFILDGTANTCFAKVESKYQAEFQKQKEHIQKQRAQLEKENKDLLDHIGKKKNQIEIEWEKLDEKLCKEGVMKHEIPDFDQW